MKNTIDKWELARRISGKEGLPVYMCFGIISFILHEITDSLKENKSVHLVGFGKFETFIRKAREGVNPQNVSERIKMPEIRLVKFRVGHNLKNQVKKWKPAQIVNKK